MSIERKLKEIIESIELEGSKTFRLIRLTQLLYKEKAKSISKVGTNTIFNLIENYDIYSAPSLAEILSKHKKDERITLTKKKIHRSKVFFDKESDLENFIFDQQLLQEKLKFNKKVERQSKLIGSKDKVDFIATKNNQKYLIEIKHKTSYYGIEQLLRYKGILEEEINRMVLITGFEDPKLHHTFAGMHSDQRKMFQWYIYDWNGNDQLTFEEIKINL